MQQKDLQQISNLMDQKFEKNNENLVTKNDLKQIFKENNEKIFKKMDDKFKKMDGKFKKMDDKIDKFEDKITRTVKQEFDQNTEQHNKMEKRFDKMDKKLEQKPNKDHMFDWADKKVHNLELDMEKAKYLHRREWKKLPPAYEIRKALAEN
ncbi:MAG: hypothetical protein U9R14_01665 [Patescibacteria group bacterium]|nr:hypothetical protein [Patescibacteria group bacterium]